MFQDEQRVLRTINEVLSCLQCAPIASVAQLFAEVEDRFLTTYRELDHYRDRQRERYYGALSKSIGARPSWPNAAGPRVYAYLKQFAGMPSVLGILKEYGLPTVIVGDGIDPSLLERYDGGNIHFEPSAVDIDAAAQECDLALLNCTHGTTAHMLLAGKPIVALPLTQEQFVTAVRVEQFGAGIAVPCFDPQQIAASFRAVLSLNSYRSRAREFAARYADWTSTSQAGLMVDRIEDLLRAWGS